MDNPSIPEALWNEGYDVWMGCKRGSVYSRGHATLDVTDLADQEDYWGFNTDDIGEKDVTAMISKILETSLDTADGVGDCLTKKVQIVAQCLGSLEALTAMAAFPDDSATKVSNVINMAPCGVRAEPAACSDDTRRRLGASEDALDGLRKLDQEMEIQASEGRQLGHYHYYSYWDRVADYCEMYEEQGACYHYCDWRPYYCEEFCSRDEFKKYCQPECISAQYAVYDALKDAGIYSMFGEDWDTKVDDVCDEVGASSDVCTALQATVPTTRPEVSLQQEEHLWQQSYTQEMDKYNPDFVADYSVDTMEIALDAISVPVISLFVENDVACNEDLSETFMEDIPNRPYSALITDDAVDNFNVGVSNDNATVLGLLIGALSLGAGQDIDDCAEDVYQWTS